jgi:hypothetical protein
MKNRSHNATNYLQFKNMNIYFLTKMLNPVIELYIQRHKNPKPTKLARTDNPPKPVYITRILKLHAKIN